MTTGEAYRAKAAQLLAEAKQEIQPSARAALEALALSYVRLAEQADKNSTNDIVYETPTPAHPSVQQQQQIQPKKDDVT